MKYFVNLKGYNEKYKFPQNGEKVFIKAPLTEEVTVIKFTPENPSGLNKPKYTHIVHTVNNEGNEAGFGWVWLYNPKTKNYDYKMSILDKRTIPGNVEIPNIGFCNLDAYNLIQWKQTRENSFELSLKNIWRTICGFFFKF